MVSKTAVLILNTQSRSGDRAEAIIKEACQKYNIAIKNVLFVLPQQKIADIVKTAVTTNVDILLVAGGDGTISNILGLLPGKNIPVGIIPLGTTNNIARSLDIPLNIDDAVKYAAGDSSKNIDLGHIGDKYFVNIISIGIPARVAGSVSDTSKKYLGRFAYAYRGLREVIINKPFTATITDQNTGAERSVKTYQLIVANGRFHAGKAVAEDASIEDGKLLAFSLGSHTIASLLWHTLVYFVLPQPKSRYISETISDAMYISCNISQPIESDGEKMGTTPLTITVRTQAVRIACP